MAWNPFSSGKLGPDACSACDSAMSKVLLFQRGRFESSPKSDFMRVIMLNIKQRPVERFASLSSRYLSSLLSFSHQPFSCSPPLFPLLCSKHSPPLCPSSWKVWFMDVWSMSAKNSHNTISNITSVIKPNIYIYSSFIPLSPPPPILSFSSFFLCLCAADCRLNIGHAGVLLVERRGSYPLIDLRILKSKIKLKVYINWPCQQFCQSNNATRERCCVM